MTTDPTTAEPELVIPSGTAPAPPPDNQPASSAPGLATAADEPPIALGAARQLVISAERLLGVGHSWSTRTGYYSAPGQTNSTNSISILGNVSDFNTAPGGLPVSFTLPRLAADLFVIRRLSVGLSAGYFRISTSVGTDTIVVSGFSLDPRAGFALPISRDVALWLRAGISFVRASESIDGQPSEVVQLLDAAFEVPLVFRVLPHVAFTLGPTLDLGIAGHANLNSPGGPVSETAIGIEGGMSGCW